MKHILKKLANEINLILDDGIGVFTVSAIRASPEAYWARPSATTIGHHPDDEHAEWGNLLHVKRVVRIAYDLADAAGLDRTKRDILVSAMLIHDIGKYGLDGSNEKVAPNHPDYVEYFTAGIPCAWYSEIVGVAKAHMGRWGTRLPLTKLEKLGHYSDYLASRRHISINVELEDY